VGSPVALMAYDDHPGYKGWRPLVELAWRRLGFEPVFIHVTAGEPDPQSVHVRAPEGLSTSAVAKYARHQYAAHEMFAGRWVFLSDVDMIPLDPLHFTMIKTGPPGFFVAGGGDFFDIRNYFPSCYVGAEQSTWSEILPPLGRETPRWLLVKDGNTDEAVLKVYLETWAHPERTLVVPRWSLPGGGRRLCKSAWRWDAEGLRAGRYVDVHLPLFGTVPEEQVAVLEEVLRA
jgi:hypothetical protein